MLFDACMTNGQSQTIRVPADSPSIYAALDAAGVKSNVTLLVSPGIRDQPAIFNDPSALLIRANGLVKEAAYYGR